MKATVRKDLVRDRQLPPKRGGGFLPTKYMEEAFSAWEPAELEDEEFNAIIVHEDGSTWCVNSIDFDFS